MKHNQRNNRTQQQQLLRIPTGRRQTSWLFTSAARKLNQGLPGKNSTSGHHVSVSPTNGDGPTQGQRKTLTRVGIEPTTFGLDLCRSTDWATTSDGSRPWKLKMLKSRQWTCTCKYTQLTLFKIQVLHGQRLYKRNLSLYLYMFIAVTLTSSVATACSRLTL